MAIAPVTKIVHHVLRDTFRMNVFQLLVNGPSVLLLGVVIAVFQR